MLTIGLVLRAPSPLFGLCSPASPVFQSIMIIHSDKKLKGWSSITNTWYQDVSRPVALQCRPPPCHLLAKAPHYPGRPPENFEILAHILCTRNSSRNILSIFAPLQVVVSLGGMKVQNMPNMPSMPKKHIMHFWHVPSSASWEGSSHKSQSQYHQL